MLNYTCIITFSVKAYLPKDRSDPMEHDAGTEINNKYIGVH